MKEQITNSLSREQDIKLLPCPFCGAEASLWSTEDTEWVMCTKCFSCSDVTDFEEHKAVGLWNSRVISS